MARKHTDRFTVQLRNIETPDDADDLFTYPVGRKEAWDTVKEFKQVASENRFEAVIEVRQVLLGMTVLAWKWTTQPLTNIDW